MKANFVPAEQFAEDCGLQVKPFQRHGLDNDPARCTVRCPGTDESAKAKIKQFIKDTGLTVVRKRSDRITVGSNYTMAFFKQAAFDKCKVNMTKIDDAAHAEAEKLMFESDEAEECDGECEEECDTCDASKASKAFGLLKRVSARVQKYGQLRPGHLTSDIEKFLLGK